MIKLIINADDFGLSKIFNEEILKLIEKNKISSTTVMINKIAEDQTIQVDNLIKLAKKHNISIGLHLEFTNNDYQKQIKKQFKKFQTIFKFKPSHIDIHKALDFTDSFQIVIDFCIKNKLPMRYHQKTENLKSPTNGAFFGSVDSFKEIEDWLKTLQDGKFYEILFHPGKYDPDCKSSLNKKREQDVSYVNKLHSLREKHDIKMVNYSQLAKTHTL